MEMQYLQGVGPKRAMLLSKELGLNSIEDLLRFFPTRYIDRSTITPIAEIVPEAAFVQVRAKVLSREIKPKRLSVIVEDSTGRMNWCSSGA